MNTKMNKTGLKAATAVGLPLAAWADRQQVTAQTVRRCAVERTVSRFGGAVATTSLTSSPRTPQPGLHRSRTRGSTASAATTRGFTGRRTRRADRTRASC